MRAVLVTGGAGYIGSHVCKSLARAGFRPIAYDNLTHGHASAIKWGPLEAGDILDTSRLAAVIRKYGAGSIIHLAAFAYVGESVTDPAKYYKNNVAGTLAMLDGARACGVDKIVFSSTCATYGIPRKIPITEDEPQNPVNPYGTSKLMIERILMDYRSAYGMSSISLRYFNAAGADPDGELGEEHDPETHLIPLVLDAASGARPHITVFGDDYDTPDGTCIRDYIHVSDLAEAHVLALRKLEQAPSGRDAYNLGTGRGYSVGEVITCARKITGMNIPVVQGPRRPGDPAILLADATRAQTELGFRLRHPGLEDMVLSAWHWSRRNPRIVHMDLDRLRQSSLVRL